MLNNKAGKLLSLLIFPMMLCFASSYAIPIRVVNNMKFDAWVIYYSPDNGVSLRYVLQGNGGTHTDNFFSTARHIRVGITHEPGEGGRYCHYSDGKKLYIDTHESQITPVTVEMNGYDSSGNLQCECQGSACAEAG